MISGVGSPSVFSLHRIATVEVKPVAGCEPARDRRLASPAAATDPPDVSQSRRHQVRRYGPYLMQLRFPPSPLRGRVRVGVLNRLLEVAAQDV